MVVTRAGRPWFALSLGVVIGVMMVCYVAVPSSLIGVKATRSRRDKLTASALSGALGAAAQPYYPPLLDQGSVVMARGVVQVSHGRLDVGMAHPLLHAADVRPSDHPRAERVAQVVKAQRAQAGRSSARS